jgi:hypothetical protein
MKPVAAFILKTPFYLCNGGLTFDCAKAALVVRGDDCLKSGTSIPISNGLLIVPIQEVDTSSAIVGGGIARTKFNCLIEVGDGLIVVFFVVMGSAPVEIDYTRIQGGY